MTAHLLPLFGSLALRGWFPWWGAALLGIAAAVIAVLLYLRESAKVVLPVRLGLAAVRVLILSFILFLALRPTWLREIRGERPRPVVVLIDDSQSMTTADARPNPADRFRLALALGTVPSGSEDLPADTPDRMTRTQLAKAVAKNPKLDLLAKLQQVGPVQAMAFGANRTNLDLRNPAWADALTAAQPRTALAENAFDLLNRDENERPAAIVVFTDGRENAGTRSLDDLARECARLAVPLHIYGIGSTAAGQLQLRDVAVQDTLFVEDNAAVPVRYRARGLAPGSRVDVKVTLNGRKVASKTITATDGDDLREQLSFEPKKEDVQTGKQELKTVIRTTLSDNTVLTDEIVKAVRIVDRKLKVLMVDSQPRWDFKFIQRGLLRDRRVEAKFMLLEGDPRAMKSSDVFLPVFPQTKPELYEYDLLILGDIPAAYFARAQQELIRDFVADGHGLIGIAGKGAGPATWIGTPLADVLPLEFDTVKFVQDTGKRPEGYRPQLTPSGIRSLLLSLDDDPVESLRIWRGLPELYWHYPVRKVKPAAEVYLVHPNATLPDGKPMPLLATHYYGKGYVMYTCIDETWRWRFNEADKLFGRFWSQAIYIAGAPRSLGSKMTQLALDNADPSLGRTGQLSARLMNSELKPLNSERIEAVVERLDVDPNDKDRTFRIELKPRERQESGAPEREEGEYVATIPFNRTGRYVVRVDNGGDQAALEYRVNLPDEHELSPGGLAEDEMRKLAAGSGGRFYREEDLPALAAAVKPQTSPFTQREELLLWNRWSLFALLALFSLEWFIRKFNSLS